MARKGRRTTDHVSVARKRKLGWTITAVAALAAVGALLALAPQPSAPAPLTADDDPTLGSADAPLTLYYFADFQCPYCREFELTQLPLLREERIDTGEARLAFKDLPILGDDSWAAAQASQHVWETSPDSYWAWHRHIYESQGSERSGWARPEQLVALSREVVGVDADGLQAALGDARHLDEVRADADDARAHGIRGTPTLVIDGKVLNALDAAAVDAAIEEAARR